MGKHATYSPSGACKWMNCRGSTAMEKGLPNPSSKYSDEGTAAHHLASLMLYGTVEADKVVGDTLVVQKDGEVAWLGFETGAISSKVKVTEEMVTYLKGYVERVHELCDENSELYVEVALPLKLITGEDAEGTGDVVIINHNHLRITDLKYGRGIPVEVEGNEQLLIYGLAAIDMFEGDHNCKIEKITVAVDQPRLEYYETFTISRDDLETFRETVMYAAQMAQTIVVANHDVEPVEMHRVDNVVDNLNPGEHCRKGFCRARDKCPALGKKVLEAIDTPSFADLDASGKPPVVDVDDMDLLASKANSIPLIESFLKAVRGAVEAALYAGKKVPGWKVVKGKKGNRAFMDAVDVEKLLKKMKIKKRYTHEEPKLFSPTRMEKSHKSGNILDKQWVQLSEHVTQAEGGNSVAKASDKREAIDVTPPAFADLENKNALADLIK